MEFHSFNELVQWIVILALSLASSVMNYRIYRVEKMKKDK